MKTLSNTVARLAAAVLLLALAQPARAILLDHGPSDPTLVFPTWYRDTNGLALKECLSTQVSPNPGAAGGTMCFPANPDPAGFAGNVGPEVFYNNVVATLGRGGKFFGGKFVAAMEGTYLPAGVPQHGTETVFARIRILMDTTVPGVYTVTHPYGVEVFPRVGVGVRAVFFTADVPVGPPLDFDTSLRGQLGPWAQWDFVDPGFTLSFTNPVNGAVETFVGDPNVVHTFTGSPFGTNFVRVDGPPGSNLDGVGNDFIVQPLAAVTGQKYLPGIPIPTTIKRATYARDPVTNLVSVDVFATSAPASNLVLTGVNLPTIAMTGDAAGNYFGHVEFPATILPPASIQVNNTTSNPVNIVTAALVDQLELTTATFDSLTSTLSVAGISSDKTGPLLTVVGPLGGPMVGGAFTRVLAPGVLPPESISVQSSAGGVEADLVTVLPGLPMNPPAPPVAVADVLTTPQNTAATLDVSANDSVVAPALLSQVLVITPPLNGKAAPIGINTGVVTYTPNLNFFGTDTFSYVLVDSAGAISNLATVTVTVSFVAPAPTPVADNFAMLANRVLPLAGRTYAVLANDGTAAGTTINPASVTISTAPVNGTATANPDGTVTYKPALGFIGIDTFQYTVANTLGNASLPATVTVTVQGAAEVLSIVKANYTVAKSAWNIVGTTTWFGTQLTQTTVTCFVGRGVGGASLGTTLVDTLGKWNLIPPPLSTPAPDATNVFTCQSSNGAVVSAVVKRI
jgi:Big-like domain-containing protein